MKTNLPESRIKCPKKLICHRHLVAYPTNKRKHSFHQISTTLLPTLATTRPANPLFSSEFILLVCASFRSSIYLDKILQAVLRSFNAFSWHVHSQWKPEQKIQLETFRPYVLRAHLTSTWTSSITHTLSVVFCFGSDTNNNPLNFLLFLAAAEH